MSNILTRIFGRKTPTADDIAREIERASTDLVKAQERTSSARAALADIAVMSDAEHAAADAAHEEARRNVARLEARVSALQTAHAEMLKKEVAASLVARAKELKRVVEVEAPKLLDEYDRLAAAISTVIGKWKDIREEVERVNRELATNPIAEPVPSIETLFRKEADHVTPERRERRTLWVRKNWFGDLEEAGVFVRDERGEKVPRDHDYRPETREVVVAHEHRRPGAYLPSLESVVLPPGRVGGKHHWPRSED